MRSAMVLLLLSASCPSSRADGPDAADAAGPNTANSAIDCDETATAVRSLDDETVLGRSANQLATDFLATGVAQLQWSGEPAPFDWVQLQVPSGTTRLTTAFERVTRAFDVHRTPHKPDDSNLSGRPPAACRDAVHLEGTLAFATEDGSFAEHWPVTLVVEEWAGRPPGASYAIDLNATAIAGTFRVQWRSVEEGAITRAWIDGTLPTPSGQVNVAKFPGLNHNTGGVAIVAAWGNQAISQPAPVSVSDAGTWTPD